MKVLCVDSFVDGHHCAYMKAIHSISKDDIGFILPEYVDEVLPKSVQYKVPYEIGKRSFSYDMKWLRQIKEIADREKPEIVHFLYGDLLFKYFGLGLELFKKYKLVVTFHVIKDDSLHKMSMKMITKKIDKGIVHTDKLFRQIRNWKIFNIEHIEYPCFFPLPKLTKQEVRKELGISDDAVVFSALGGTRRYKGLDFLLSAMKNVNGNAHLLIAGSEEHFTKEYIEKESEGYKDRVTAILHQLSDEEFMKAIIVSDWIVLPYRKGFTGASGPLAEGVMYGKGIIGAQIGSIGDLIKEHELGYSFEAENIEELSKAMIKAISDKTEKSEKYLHYQNSLRPEIFAEKYKNTYLQFFPEKKEDK